MLPEISEAITKKFKGISKSKTLEMLKYLGVDIEPIKSTHYTKLRKMIPIAVNNYKQPFFDKFIKLNKVNKVFPVVYPTEEELKGKLTTSVESIFKSAGEILKFTGFESGKTFTEVIQAQRETIKGTLSRIISKQKSLKVNISARVIYRNEIKKSLKF